MQYPVDGLLDDVLRGLRIEATAPYEATLSAPWGIEIKGMPGLIACYLFRRGRCWITVGQEVVGWLEEGDLLLLLGGQPHALRSAPDEAVIPLPKPHHTGESCDWRTSRTFSLGGDGEVSRALLFTLKTERARTNPLLVSAPGWLRVEGALDDEGSPLSRTLELLETELRYAEAGLGAVIDRLGEIVLAQALRGFLKAEYGSTCEFTGWLRGAADPRISVALRQMQLAPEKAWSVAQLASVAAMSRTGFAVRFANVVGVTPLAFLRRLRIDRACELLRGEDESVAVIAERVGYASEAAFCRAFKREVGSTPRQWCLGRPRSTFVRPVSS